MESFNTKVNKAAAMFLNRRGYDILDEPWKRDGGMLPIDIVAKDGDSVVFVRARGRNAEFGEGFDDAGLDRDKAEAFAVNWFRDNIDEFADAQFRFDAISMIVMGAAANKALIRHHINALSESCASDLPKTSEPSEEARAAQAA